MSHATLSPHLLRKLAVETCSDPRTVARVLRNEHVLDLTRERVTKAIRAAGFGYLLRGDGDDEPRSAA